MAQIRGSIWRLKLRDFLSKHAGWHVVESYWLDFFVENEGVNFYESR